MALQAKALVKLTGILIFLWLSALNVAMAQEGEGDSGSTGININNEGPVEIKKGGTYTITGGELTDKTITVKLDSKDAVANITIVGVKITTNKCPFDIIQGTVNLTLAGKDNVLEAGVLVLPLKFPRIANWLLPRIVKGS